MTLLRSVKIGCQDKPDSLFFIIHGYGATAENIAPLANAFTGRYPKALFIVPNAPHPHPLDPSGAMWFEITELSEPVLNAGLKESVPLLRNEIKYYQEFYQVPAKKTVVMGFSQGSMIALALNQWGETVANTIIGFSGGLPFVPESCDKNVRYLLIHGTDDAVVVPERGKEAYERLQKAGCQVELQMIAGLDHSIDAHAVESALDFLEREEL
jgi:phospholipase/carboxylesterase